MSTALPAGARNPAGSRMVSPAVPAAPLSSASHEETVCARDPQVTAQKPRSRALPPGALAGPPAVSGLLLRAAILQRTHTLGDQRPVAAMKLPPTWALTGTCARRSSGGRKSERAARRGRLRGWGRCRPGRPPRCWWRHCPGVPPLVHAAPVSAVVTVPAGVSESFSASHCDTRWIQSPPWSHRISP